MKQPDFGKKLIEIRKVRGLTQDELAAKCKITIRTVQRIESGLVLPRAFTLKVLSDNLEFDFLEISNGNKVNDSKLKWFNVILWHARDLFNLKTNTMKKVSILSIILCFVCVGLFALINDSKAQDSSKLDKYHFLKSNSRGIIYYFQRDELVMISNVKDTADYKVKGGLIQEYKNKIFLNGKYVGKALKCDTVIYNQGNITIRPSNWVFKSSYGQNLHYLIPKGTWIDNDVVHVDTEYLYIGKHQIKEHKYKIYLDDVFQGQADPGDSVRFKDGSVEIMR
jgi:transcriptional regulator with XRE-family HTH domain